MLNPFPTQFLALYAYFILRVFVGGLLLRLGIIHFRQREELSYVLKLPWFPFGKTITIMFAGIEIIVAIMYLTGFYTQIAALLTVSISIKMLFLRQKFDHPALPSKLFYLLLLGVSIVLFITGGGHFAFDLPI